MCFHFPLLYIFLASQLSSPNKQINSNQTNKATPTTTTIVFTFGMKRLIRRLSRVADASSQYSLLRSDTTAAATTTTTARQRTTSTRRAESFRVAVSSLKKQARQSVPEGHVPIYVGEEMELFVVNAELLNHPVFIALLNKSAQEYGYEQKGVLHIPCHVLVFERVMEALRLGVDSRDLQDLLRSSSDDCFFDY